MPSVAPDPAATVVVLRDTPDGPEVFMVRRHDEARFMAGAHVFPGGRVEPDDLRDPDGPCLRGTDEAHRLPSDLPAREAMAFHVAAIRELFEEAGVLLAHGPLPSVGDVMESPDTATLGRLRADVHAGPCFKRSSQELVCGWITRP